MGCCHVGVVFLLLLGVLSVELLDGTVNGSGRKLLMQMQGPPMMMPPQRGPMMMHQPLPGAMLLPPAQGHQFGRLAPPPGLMMPQVQMPSPYMMHPGGMQVPVQYIRPVPMFTPQQQQVLDLQIRQFLSTPPCAASDAMCDNFLTLPDDELDDEEESMLDQLREKLSELRESKWTEVGVKTTAGVTFGVLFAMAFPHLGIGALAAHGTTSYLVMNTAAHGAINVATSTAAKEVAGHTIYQEEWGANVPTWKEAAVGFAVGGALSNVPGDFVDHNVVNLGHTDHAIHAFHRADVGWYANEGGLNYFGEGVEHGVAAATGHAAGDRPQSVAMHSPTWPQYATMNAAWADPRRARVEVEEQVGPVEKNKDAPPPSEGASAKKVAVDGAISDDVQRIGAIAIHEAFLDMKSDVKVETVDPLWYGRISIAWAAGMDVSEMKPPNPTFPQCPASGPALVPCQCGTGVIVEEAGRVRDDVMTIDYLFPGQLCVPNEISALNGKYGKHTFESTKLFLRVAEAYLAGAIPCIYTPTNCPACTKNQGARCMLDTGLGTCRENACVAAETEVGQENFVEPLLLPFFGVLLLLLLWQTIYSGRKKRSSMLDAPWIMAEEI